MYNSWKKGRLQISMNCSAIHDISTAVFRTKWQRLLSPPCLRQMATAGAWPKVTRDQRSVAKEQEFWRGHQKRLNLRRFNQKLHDYPKAKSIVALRHRRVSARPAVVLNLSKTTACETHETHERRTDVVVRHGESCGCGSCGFRRVRTLEVARSHKRQLTR